VFPKTNMFYILFVSSCVYIFTFYINSTFLVLKLHWRDSVPTNIRDLHWVLIFLNFINFFLFKSIFFQFKTPWAQSVPTDRCVLHLICMVLGLHIYFFYIHSTFLVLQLHWCDMTLFPLSDVIYTMPSSSIFILTSFYLPYFLPATTIKVFPQTDMVYNLILTSPVFMLAFYLHSTFYSYYSVSTDRRDLYYALIFFHFDINLFQIYFLPVTTMLS
jgi:hypothetical protein